MLRKVAVVSLKKYGVFLWFFQVPQAGVQLEAKMYESCPSSLYVVTC